MDDTPHASLAILLAVYEPREDWLIELLDSLNRQTYPHVTLYVRDDASPTYSFDRLQRLVKEHITAFPVFLYQNEKNLGSNQTFEALVRDANERYIAFCDQDDVWLPDKLKNTVELLQNSPLSPTLVCTNVSVMDGEGNEIAPTIDAHRRRHVLLRGRELAPQLIYRNFVMGCTVVMERERALSYLPFPDEAVHDHYLAFRAALDGALDFLPEPQMRYRVYGGNQTGVMTGVRTKQDYYHRRILAFEGRITCFSAFSSLPALTEASAWVEARKRNFHRQKGGFGALWRTRHINRAASLFELFALRFPAPLFRVSVRLVQKGVL